MTNKLLAITLILICTHASAGQYSDEVATQEMCKAASNMAQRSYDVKAAGVDFETFQKHIKPEMLEGLKLAMLKGYNAPDREAAGMRGWALCMDGHR